MNHVGRHHQHAARGDRRLRVVALLEAAARHRHDARILVGQIDLIARQRSFGRRPRRLAARLLARRRDLGLPRRAAVRHQPHQAAEALPLGFLQRSELLVSGLNAKFNGGFEGVCRFLEFLDFPGLAQSLP